MTPEFVIDLARETLSTAFWVVLPILATGTAIGVIMSIVQAATQIQEPALAFLPKLVGMAAALIIFGPSLLTRLADFTVKLFHTAATSVGG